LAFSNETGKSRIVPGHKCKKDFLILQPIRAGIDRVFSLISNEF
jgi:hypothetical protein